MVKGIIFDVDGTIVDSLAMYLTCMNDELRKAGVSEVSKEFLYKNLGMGVALRDILRKLIPKNENLVEKIAEGIVKQFWKVDAEITFLPGVNNTLAYLKKNKVKIGLATGRVSGADYEWKKFKHAGITPYIDVIITCAEVKERKPSPEIIIRCAEMLSLHPRDCIVVGDAVADVSAARQADAIGIGVCTGVDTRMQLEKAGADVVLERLDHLIDLFEKNVT